MTRADENREQWNAARAEFDAMTRLERDILWVVGSINDPPIPIRRAFLTPEAIEALTSISTADGPAPDDVAHAFAIVIDDLLAGVGYAWHELDASGRRRLLKANEARDRYLANRKRRAQELRNEGLSDARIAIQMTEERDAVPDLSRDEPIAERTVYRWIGSKKA